MASQQTLSEVLAGWTRRFQSLEDAVDRQLEVRENYRDAEEEVQRMNADRSKLAGELDTAEARAERLEDVNKEVSRRLVTAMETIRAVLDR
jgi:DNA repair exonuclease SbcCD ATPase subunit